MTTVRFDVLAGSTYTLTFSDDKLESITGRYVVHPLGYNTNRVDQELIDLINERLPGNLIAIEYFVKLFIEVYDNMYCDVADDKGNYIIHSDGSRPSLKEFLPEDYGRLWALWERNLPKLNASTNTFNTLVSVVSKSNESHTFSDFTPTHEVLKCRLEPSKHPHHYSFGYTAKAAHNQ